MKWLLLDFKSANEPWFEHAEAAYLKKINYFINFETIHLKTNKADREQADIKIKFEEARLFEKLTSEDYIIVFDEKGKKHDSVSFSKLIDKAGQSGKKRGVLILGGAYGLSDAVKNKATQTISLSDLTMNHLVAELVVLEQLYRAQTILNRIPYHNA